MSSTCQNPVSSCLATIALKANKSYSRALCILTPSFPTDNLLLKKCSVLKYLPRKKPLSPRLLSVVQRQMFLPLRARWTIGHWSVYPKIKINYAQNIQSELLLGKLFTLILCVLIKYSSAYHFLGHVEFQLHYYKICLISWVRSCGHFKNHTKQYILLENVCLILATNYLY